MEGWKEKTKEKGGADRTLDAEDSLEDLELKGKAEPQADPVGRKPKRVRMERLKGWGIGTSPGYGVEDGGDVQLKDWKEATMTLTLEAIQK
jgi:hypothetical protein